ncbi:MAG: carboxylate--amine ligase [Haloferacaceae archaeon]
MADAVLPFDDLLTELEATSFDRPPALVANAHITGLGVARALARHDVPVVALDRSGDGVAPASDAVDLAGRVTYPLDDRAGFRDDLERVAERVAHEPVAFACMDEWVHALAATEPAGVRLPFSDREVIDAVLDKESLYGLAADLDVPVPETYRVAETHDGSVDPAGTPPATLSADEAAAELGFPLVVKPARKREFEELVGTNVVEVGDAEAYRETVERAREAGVRVMAQEKVSVVPGGDRSLASYRPPDGEGETLGLVGASTRQPAGYGTACLVDVVAAPSVRERSLSLLAAAGYHGISEVEYVRDGDREEHVLLDLNTRPWKWIGLPTAAEQNLPMAAYADATGASYGGRREPRDARWVSLRDYLERLSTEPGDCPRLARAEWRALAAGAFDAAGLGTAVFDPDDPGPTADLLATAFGERTYYCSC